MQNVLLEKTLKTVWEECFISQVHEWPNKITFTMKQQSELINLFYLIEENAIDELQMYSQNH